MGSYGRGIQLPSAIQLGGNALQNFGYLTFNDVEGNPFLKPTVFENYTVDYTHKIPRIGSQVKGSVFYTAVSDIVSPFVVANSTVTDGVDTYYPVYSQNIGNSHSLGGEISFAGKNLTGYRWNASYSFVKVHDDQTVKPYNGYEGSTPQNKLRFLLGYTTGDWEFDTNSQYSSSRNMLRSYNGGVDYAHVRTDGYYSLGGRIGYALSDQFTIALTGTNLSQAYTQENPFPKVERQVFLSLTGHY